MTAPKQKRCTGMRPSTARNLSLSVAKARLASGGNTAKEIDMGTTNTTPMTSKEAKKLAEQARKQAESKGWQSMAYKFSAPKGKK
jgi:hypothetical protein